VGTFGKGFFLKKSSSESSPSNKFFFVFAGGAFLTSLGFSSFFFLKKSSSSSSSNSAPLPLAAGTAGLGFGTGVAFFYSIFTSATAGVYGFGSTLDIIGLT
jgi:hypothetical protein